MKKLKIIFFNPLFILFLLTVTFRLWFAFSHLSFGQDFARDLYIVEELTNKAIIFVDYGPKASVGNFYLPPFYYQLLLFFTIISGKSLVMTALITLVESITPIILYWILRDFMKKNSAFIGALIYSFSGLAVTFGTFAWNPNMIPFFTTLSIFFIGRYHKKKQALSLIGSLVSLMLAFHLHYQVAVLFPFYFGFFVYLVMKKQLNIRHWIIALIIAFIPFVPYIKSEVANNFANSGSIIKYFTEEHSKYYDRVSKISYLTTYLPSFIERQLTKTNMPYLWIGRLLFAVGIISFFKLTFKKKTFIYFLYFCSIFIALRLYKGDKLDYYLSTIFILPSILMASIIERNKIAGIALSATVLLISGFSLGQVRVQNQFNDLKATMQSLDENFESESARLIIHEIDFANTVLFGLNKYTKISVDQSSLNVIDICRAGTDCVSIKPYCYINQSEIDIYSSLVRMSGSYVPIFSIKKSSLPFQLYVGKFEQEPQRIPHPFSSTFDTYGTDLINTDILK